MYVKPEQGKGVGGWGGWGTHIRASVPWGDEGVDWGSFSFSAAWVSSGKKRGWRFDKWLIMKTLVPMLKL